MLAKPKDRVWGGRHNSGAVTIVQAAAGRLIAKHKARLCPAGFVERITRSTPSFSSLTELLLIASLGCIFHRALAGFILWVGISTLVTLRRAVLIALVWRIHILSHSDHSPWRQTLFVRFRNADMQIGSFGSGVGCLQDLSR